MLTSLFNFKKVCIIFLFLISIQLAYCCVDFIDEVEFGQLHGFSAAKEMKEDNGWTFGSSLLFTTSIGTTVGKTQLP